MGTHYKEHKILHGGVLNKLKSNSACNKLFQDFSCLPQTSTYVLTVLQGSYNLAVTGLLYLRQTKV